MSRVINTSGPGKRRNQLRRTIAEILRRMMFKVEVDEETRDMAALLIFSLREIAQTIEEATDAWEKRNYYIKADRFRLEWEWVRPSADRLENIILHDDWDTLPQELAKLLPHFADVKISKMTRKPSVWKSCYQLLRAEKTG